MNGYTKVDQLTANYNLNQLIVNILSVFSSVTIARGVKTAFESTKSTFKKRRRNRGRKGVTNQIQGSDSERAGLLDLSE